MKFHLPPRIETAEGRPRRAGFELEFAGIRPREVAKIVAETLGGEVRRVNEFQYEVAGGRFGDVDVELDASILKDQLYADYFREMGLDLDELDIRAPVEAVLLDASAALVPCEVVLPPIPFGELDAAEEVRERLHAAKAQGTRASLFYAFGMHINIEAPDLEAATLLQTLRAFLLLEDWIRDQSDIDFLRWLSPYIDRFPSEYAELVLDPAYRPTFEDFTADYLEHNPTRNRPLDLLPMLASREPDLVRSRMRQNHLLKPRPAFHYRLPNCLIDDPDWRIADDWSRWVEVERLASDARKMRAMSGEYLDRIGSFEALFEESWAETAARWIGK